MEQIRYANFVLFVFHVIKLQFCVNINHKIIHRRKNFFFMTKSLLYRIYIKNITEVSVKEAHILREVIIQIIFID